MMDEIPLPDIEFDLATKKGRQWRTVGTARLTKSGKGYACTLDKGEKMEGRFCLFPKSKTDDQQQGAPQWAWEEYGLE